MGAWLSLASATRVVTDVGGLTVITLPPLLGAALGRTERLATKVLVAVTRLDAATELDAVTDLDAVTERVAAAELGAMELGEAAALDVAAELVATVELDTAVELDAAELDATAELAADDADDAADDAADWAGGAGLASPPSQSACPPNFTTMLTPAVAGFSPLSFSNLAISKISLSAGSCRSVISFRSGLMYIRNVYCRLSPFSPKAPGAL
jgi:hypothetical protein